MLPSVKMDLLCPLLMHLNVSFVKYMQARSTSGDPSAAAGEVNRQGNFQFAFHWLYIRRKIRRQHLLIYSEISSLTPTWISPYEQRTSHTCVYVSAYILVPDKLEALRQLFFGKWWHKVSQTRPFRGSRKNSFSGTIFKWEHLTKSQFCFAIR